MGQALLGGDHEGHIRAHGKCLRFSLIEEVGYFLMKRIASLGPFLCRDEPLHTGFDSVAFNTVNAAACRRIQLLLEQLEKYELITGAGATG